MLRKNIVVFLFVVLMSVQNVTSVKAESVYEEYLTIDVGLLENMNCSAGLEFTVSSPNGPIDTSEFTSEPSFVYLYAEFIPLETMPEMTKTQDTPERITFQTDIAGSSYNDIKLRFKIVNSGEDLTTMYAAATILGAFFCIAGFYLLRRRRLKSSRYRL